MSKEHFSIIMPLYNKGKYVDRSIMSVLDQTWEHYELIVVNDGSTDNSLDIVSKYNDKRVKIINQHNMGHAAARNNGFKVSKNELIAFIDADDQWMHDYLETILKLKNIYNNVDVWGTSCLIKKKDKLSKYVNDKFKFILNTNNYYLFDYFDNINVTGMMNNSTTVIKKDIFENISGFNANLRLGTVSDIQFRLALETRFAWCSDEKAIIYRDMDDNVFGDRKIYIYGTPPLLNYKKIKGKEELKIIDRKKVNRRLFRYLIKFYIGNYLKGEIMTVRYISSTSCKINVRKCISRIIYIYTYIPLVAHNIMRKLLKTICDIYFGKSMEYKNIER